MNPPINHLRDIIRISLPIVVGQLGMVLTGFFDNYMVAQLGHEELAAAGICNSVYFLAAVFPMGVTIAFSTIIGILLGKNRQNTIYIFLKNALYTTAFMSVFTVLILIGVIHNFEIFGQEHEVNLLSIPYMKLLAISFTPMLFFFMFKHVADGFSYTIAGMKVTLYALALNVFLNWVLIHGNLGMPAYGLNGAGYATIISRIYLAIAMFYFLFKSKQIPVYFRKLQSSWKSYKSVSFYDQIWKLGAPSGLQYFFEIAAFVFVAIMAGWVNSESLAAHQMAITIAALTYMFAAGISSGSSICVAKSYGNKNAENIKAYGKNAHILGVSIMFFFSIVLIVFSTPLAHLFSNEKEVYELGARLLILAGVFQLGDGIQAISLGLLRGIEDTAIPSVIIFIAYWFISMPLAYYLCFKSPFQMEFYNARRRNVANAKPNSAHLAIARLEKEFDVQIVTQNIDNLHEQAGSSKVLHLHGEITKSCSSYDLSEVRDIGFNDIEEGMLCTKGYQIRPFIVWFGEPVPMLEVGAKHVGS